MHRSHFGNEEVALLIDDQYVVVGACAPDAHHDAVAWRQHIVAACRIAECRRKTSFKKIGGNGFSAIEVELRYALCAQAGGATVMLEVSVGIIIGTLEAGMTVPLGPITTPAGILAGLTVMPLLAGLGLVLAPRVLELL